MAAIDLETYLGLDSRPEGFDSFWKEQVESLSGLNISYELKDAIRDDLAKFIYKETKRKPMILPVIMNI